MRKKYYLASSFDRKEEMQGVAAVVEALGHEVVSSWVFGDQQERADIHALNSGYDEALKLYGRIAQKNISDVTECDVLAQFTEIGSFSTGSHVEFGAAMSLGKDLHVVGPLNNVFHADPDVLHFENWPRYVMWLAYSVKPSESSE